MVRLGSVPGAPALKLAPLLPIPWVRTVFPPHASTHLKPPTHDLMFKFAFILGIAIEWLRGPLVASADALASASLRALMFMLLAWTILESCRLLYRAVQSLEDQA